MKLVENIGVKKTLLTDISSYPRIKKKMMFFETSDQYLIANIYIILDGIEGCMRIYCTRHGDIHRAGTARLISS